MNLSPIIIIHLLFIVPAIALGPVVLMNKKGDRTHKRLGKIWAVCMLIASAASFGIQHNGHFTWLHGLAAYTIYSVARGIMAAKNGAIESHRRSMVGSYIGSAIAFLFAFHPERLLGQWFFALFN